MSKGSLGKIEQIESEIIEYRIIEPIEESKIEKYIEVEFEDFFVEVDWSEIEPYLPIDKYKLATIIYLYHMDDTSL
ncbi:Uncharacterised protein [uncultured Clostridium sp.]|uniref:hypothetical protein n=1 Tax=uncultured Clostridium sp. TaxID=59620 RepID=UPI000822E375|nr:hypothetical protein [uncultured Clostridium sp.]SCK02115.1 Uncharacterised protein [uncultured Clostridium sp.]